MMQIRQSMTRMFFCHDRVGYADDEIPDVAKVDVEPAIKEKKKSK